ncbi:MAG: DUF3108 domain-containing protein [Nitrosomonadales bacterium]|nr:DUF3108 domain-containing protein [Nitrosomonadales bacterium]
MKSTLRALAWLMLFISGHVLADPPTRILANYDVYKGPLRIGQIEESYARDQDRYTLTSATSAVGLLAIFNPGRILISSSGLVGSRGLRPLRFSDQRERHESRNRSAEFDWNAGRLTMIQQEQRTTVALPEGTQDRLSSMYQFMFLSPQPGATLDFAMTNGGNLDDYHYTVTRGEPLKTPAGEFSTLYLDSHAKKGETRTELWLATQQYNLPCKMIVTDPDGDQLTQILRSIETQ